MAPSAALSSQVFGTYAAIALALVVGGGLVIGILRWGFRLDVSHAWRSYSSWLVMIPIVFLAVLAGRLPLIALLTLLAIFAFREYARSTGLFRDWLMTSAGYIGILAVGAVSAVHDPVLNVLGWYGLFVALPAYVIAAILLMPIIRNRCEGQLQAMSLAILGFLYIGWMFGHLAFLANAKNAYGYVLFLVFAVEINDVAAYTFGKTLGRHPLRSKISPRKTWEGAIGALAVSMAMPWALRFSFPLFTATELLLTGLIVGIAGQLGDLSMSVIKRDLGIKDMGTLIRGHGGILDRIDSLIYVTPLFFHMVRWCHGLY
ncbi:MAG: phosphatidate cytidylyltransferase [Planctomycetaceae bacterium]|nr:phosphatidate cytidylyltransferase [Planctomycetaceae bacterium]